MPLNCLMPKGIVSLNRVHELRGNTNLLVLILFTVLSATSKDFIIKLLQQTFIKTSRLLRFFLSFNDQVLKFHQNNEM